MFKRSPLLSSIHLSALMRVTTLLAPCAALFMTLSLKAAIGSPVTVTLQEDSSGLQYRISSRDGRLRSSDVNLSLTDDAKPLHTVEIIDASTKKKWLKSFTESKSHPYIKGILVRERSGGGVQIRTRFKAKPRLPRGYAASVTITEDSGELLVKLPSPMKEPPSQRAVSKAAEEAKSAADQSAQLKKEVENIRHITAQLKDQPGEKKKASALPAKPTPPERVSGSPFERGVRPPPTPKLGGPLKRSVDTSSQQGTLSRAGAKAPGVTPTPPVKELPVLSPKSPSGELGTFAAPPLSSPPPAPPKVSAGQGSPNKPVSPKPAAERSSSFEELTGVPSDQQIMIVAVLFMVALLGLFLMKRSGKSPFGAHGEIPFKVRSRQVVNAQWNQEILIVDVLDRTLLLGSSASGGLTLLAQISPDPYPQPAPQPRYQDYSDYPESDDYPAERYEQERYAGGAYQDEQFAEPYAAEPEYYPEQRGAPRLDVSQRPAQHEPAIDDGDSGYTLEVPMSEMDSIPAQVTADLTAERAVPVNTGFNASTALGGLEALVSEAQSRATASSPTPEPSSVSADDLLQKIRQLNQG